MSQIYNENTESLKLGISGILSWEFTHSVGNSAECLRSRRELLGQCIFGNTPKICCISLLKVAPTFLSGSGKGAVGA